MVDSDSEDDDEGDLDERSGKCLEDVEGEMIHRIRPSLSNE